jgi:hypothetical protein
LTFTKKTLNYKPLISAKYNKFSTPKSPAAKEGHKTSNHTNKNINQTTNTTTTSKHAQKTSSKQKKAAISHLTNIQKFKTSTNQHVAILNEPRAVLINAEQS